MMIHAIMEAKNDICAIVREAEVFVNGDSFIPNAKALVPVFKARMFGDVTI